MNARKYLQHFQAGLITINSLSFTSGSNSDTLPNEGAVFRLQQEVKFFKRHNYPLSELNHLKVTTVKVCCSSIIS
jgi:hypothetical protein